MKNTIKQEFEKVRFTTLINPESLTKIKLISYLSNRKLFECIDEAIILYVNEYEMSNNTSLSSIINIQANNITSITDIEFK